MMSRLGANVDTPLGVTAESVDTAILHCDCDSDIAWAGFGKTGDDKVLARWSMALTLYMRNFGVTQ